METKNFDELIKQKLAEIEALKQEKEEMERAKKANIENLQKEDDNKTKIAVEQLQLGTQRIK